MIHESLKRMNIKITELANYLGVSRPTLYKAIEDYDKGVCQSISPKTLSLFKYIENNKLIGKNNVISYILNELPKIDNPSLADEIMSSTIVGDAVRSDPNSEKSKFLIQCSQSTDYDIVIHYLVQLSMLLKKKHHTEQEKEMMKPYEEIIKMYSINKGERE